MQEDIKPAFQALTRSMYSLVEWIRFRLQQPYEQCGWDPKEGEDRYTTTSRPVLLSVLNSVCEEESIKQEALRRYHQWMKNGDGTC